MRTDVGVRLIFQTIKILPENEHETFTQEEIGLSISVESSLPSADTAICRDLDGYNDYRPDPLGKARECRENSRLRPPLQKGQPEQRQKHKREGYLACTVI